MAREPVELMALDAAVEAAMALLQAAPNQEMMVTSLNKALFYLDLVALRDEGHTLTGGRWLAVERGPILDGYKETLIPELCRRGLAEQQVDEQDPSRPVRVVTPLAGFRCLNEYLHGRARDIAAFFGSRTARDASRLSHQNVGWSAAWRTATEKASKWHPINMYVAMQTLVEPDPWLDAPLTSEETTALAAADSKNPEPF